MENCRGAGGRRAVCGAPKVRSRVFFFFLLFGLVGVTVAVFCFSADFIYTRSRSGGVVWRIVRAFSLGVFRVIHTRIYSASTAGPPLARVRVIRVCAFVGLAESTIATAATVAATRRCSRRATSFEPKLPLLRRSCRCMCHPLPCPCSYPPRPRTTRARPVPNPPLYSPQSGCGAGGPNQPHDAGRGPRGRHSQGLGGGVQGSGTRRRRPRPVPAGG